MEELITYKVTFKETADEWLFQYRKDDGVVYSFFNLKGKRVLKLLENVQFPGTKNEMENWTKYKHLVTIEMVLNDYSFEAFWIKYNLKIKKEKAETAWKKLDFVDTIKCFNQLPKYHEYLAKTTQAKAHLVTWLNQKRYNDEY
ncbi:hypothetical protein KHA90_23895 [Flavobacterium psychroterrae]|uniref:Uncharacterized protein n=1 Tax=Flavobacterium psychroterrae TaxID=2133767 RepID=A0ABS5PKN6_9FLAO|nr:hypothetical protein [Flavobacterium psychroterrae]MBS7234051.1 hypothetical protein [Flavobacterium psychroterrae]